MPLPATDKDTPTAEEALEELASAETDARRLNIIRQLIADKHRSRQRLTESLADAAPAEASPPPRAEAWVPAPLTFSAAEEEAAVAEEEEREEPAVPARARAGEPATAATPAAAAGRRKVTTSEVERFFQRQMSWQESRQREREQRRAEQEQELLQECTFQPQTNESATGTRDGLAASVRLFHEWKDRADDLHGRQLAASASAPELEECTFRPQTNAVSKFVSSRYREASFAYSEAPPRQVSLGDSVTPDDVENCTFSPAITPLPRRASSQRVREYLENDAFSRLSQPSPSKSTAGTEGPGSSSGSGGRRAGPKKSRRASFEQFLERQTKHVVNKELRAKETQLQLERDTARRVPAVDPKSEALVRNKGGFVERQRAHERQRQEALRRHEEHINSNFVHRPQISRKAQQRKGRSVEELSMGDNLRKQAAREAARLRAEEEQAQAASFQPAKIAAQPGINSTLGSESYVETLLEKARRQEERTRWHLERREREEAAECTFKPTIHESPTYIRQMAAARRKSAPGRGQAERVRPDWR